MLDVRQQGYDLLLSNKSGFGTAFAPDVPQVCYCLAPTRYVWEFDAAAGENLPGALKRDARRPSPC